jgi:hypothetical protein
MKIRFRFFFLYFQFVCFFVFIWAATSSYLLEGTTRTGPLANQTHTTQKKKQKTEQTNKQERKTNENRFIRKKKAMRERERPVNLYTDQRFSFSFSLDFVYLLLVRFYHFVRFPTHSTNPADCMAQHV